MRRALPPDRRHDPLLAGVALWLALVTLWLTWTPFSFVASPGAAHLYDRTTFLDAVGNLVLLVPIGAAAALFAPRRPVLTAALAGAALSGLIETGQLFLPDRIVSAADVALNSAGAMLAGAATTHLLRRVTPFRLLITLAVAIYVSLVAYSIHAGAVFRDGMRLAGWDPSFEIVAGDEVGGDRRYEGRVRDVVICAGPPTGSLCAGPGATPAAREALARAAERSQRVTLEARVLSASDVQGGPTRIATFSDGPFDRNLTLGQEGTALVLRIRTPMMGANGRDYELWIPAAVQAGVPVAIRVEVEAGKVRTRLTTASGTRIVRHDFGPLSSGVLLRGGRDNVTAWEVRSSRVAVSLLLAMLPLLLLTHLLLQRGGDRARRRQRPAGPSDTPPR